MQVRAEAEVTAVEGRKVIFTVRAFDDKEEIGVGSHERFAVQKEKFLSKAEAKH
jgi:predicted thioesterase